MSRLLALCTGLSAGYLVGWLAGSNVQRLAEARRLASERRAARAFLAAEGADPTPEQRAKARAVAPVRVPEPRTAREGTTRRPDPGTALRGEIPAQRDDEPTFDEHGHCTAVSPGGGLRCIVTGPHAGHWWEAVYAPDAKDDADERIE